MSNSKKGKQVSGDTEFSALKEMGIKNPSEICRYSLRQEDGEDVLRVYYKRRNGRTNKTIITDSGKPEYAQGDEFSAFLESAVAELDEIVRNSKDHEVLKTALLDEFDHLEKYVNSRVKALRAQAEQL